MANNSNLNSNGDSNSSSDSSNVFETLFGDVPEQHQTSVSIFSDENPFRRKPSNPTQTPQQSQQLKLGLGLGFGSAEDLEDTTSGECGNPSIMEVKKRKRREEKPSLDTGVFDNDDSGIRLEIKKLKMDEPKSSDFGVGLERKGEGKSPDMGFDLKDLPRRAKGKEHTLDAFMADVYEVDRGKANNMGFQSVEMAKQEEGKDIKKKRKRDEVEADYEALRYRVDDGGGEGELRGKTVGKKRKTIDDPADMMVSKEGFDDEAKLLRTVFVGNLPLKAKKKGLFKEFSQFGEIEFVRIRYVPLLNTKISRKGAIIQEKINDAVDSVHAYIVFKTEEAAHASLAHNVALVGGYHIRVDRACPPRKKLKGDNVPPYDNKRIVVVGNLPFDVKDEEIYQLFAGIKDLESSIEAIRVIRDSGTSVGKGIAYVLFETRGDANLVVKKRSLKLRDRELRLYHPTSNLTPSKRKNMSPGEGNQYQTKKLAVAASLDQGLQASTSGVEEKVHSKVLDPVSLQSSTSKGEKSRERMIKRPEVAARKADVLKGDGASKYAAEKRKLESQTPESSCSNNKTRKLR